MWRVKREIWKFKGLENRNRRHNIEPEAIKYFLGRKEEIRVNASIIGQHPAVKEK